MVILDSTFGPNTTLQKQSLVLLPSFITQKGGQIKEVIYGHNNTYIHKCECRYFSLGMKMKPNLTET